MKKVIFTFLLLAIISLDYSFAVPAKQSPFTITLTDGTTLTVRLFGDEHSHYYTSLDHYLLIQDADGYFYYAESNSENKLQRSPYKVKDIDQRTLVEKNFLATIDKEHLLSLQQMQEMKSLKKKAPRKAMQKATNPTTSLQKAKLR